MESYSELVEVLAKEFESQYRKIHDISAVELISIFSPMSTYGKSPITTSLGLAATRILSKLIKKVPDNIKPQDKLVIFASLALLSYSLMVRSRPSRLTQEASFGAGLVLAWFVTFEFFDLQPTKLKNKDTIIKRFISAISEEALIALSYAASTAVAESVRKPLAKLVLAQKLSEEIDADARSINSFNWGFLVGLISGGLLYLLTKLQDLQKASLREKIKQVLLDKKLMLFAAAIGAEAFLIKKYAELIKSVLEFSPTRGQIAKTAKKLAERTNPSLSKKIVALLMKLHAAYIKSKLEASGVKSLLKKHKVLRERNRMKAESWKILVKTAEKYAKTEKIVYRRLVWQAVYEVLKKAIENFPDIIQLKPPTIIFTLFLMETQCVDIINGYTYFDVSSTRPLQFYIEGLLKVSPSKVKEPECADYFVKIVKGLISHELGHFYLLHTLQGLAIALSWIIAMLILVFTVSKQRLHPYAASAFYLSMMVFLGNYYRRMELQADAFSAEIDPEAAQETLRLLQKKYSALTDLDFLTEEMHGLPTTRIENILHYLARVYSKQVNAR